MNLNPFKKEHKELKTKVNEAETTRQLDRTFSAWKSLKDLKKMKQLSESVQQEIPDEPGELDLEKIRTYLLLKSN